MNHAIEKDIPEERMCEVKISGTAPLFTAQGNAAIPEVTIFISPAIEPELFVWGDQEELRLRWVWNGGRDEAEGQVGILLGRASPFDAFIEKSLQR